MSSFVKQADVSQEDFDWGRIGWRLTPDKGAKTLVVMDVVLEPGEGHAFHRHPGQEEMIIVKQGEITQFLEQDSTTLGPLDSCYLAPNEARSVENKTNVPASMLVVMPYPEGTER